MSSTIMRFQHSDGVREAFPDLVAGVVAAGGITPDTDATARVEAFTERARARLAGVGSLADLPEIAAWRRAFGRMGLKPTQYRCASEALLRRLSKEGSLPRIHPLVDLCNAVSVAWAVPVAALDLDRVDGDLEVRRAGGDEVYETFGGGLEHPEPGEISFVDGSGRAHARRWTNRQSGYSAVRESTANVLIVVEGLHATAAADVADATAAVASGLAELWAATPSDAVLYGPDGRRAFEASPAGPRTG